MPGAVWQCCCNRWNALGDLYEAHRPSRAVGGPRQDPKRVLKNLFTVFPHSGPFGVLLEPTRSGAAGRRGARHGAARPADSRVGTVANASGDARRGRERRAAQHGAPRCTARRGAASAQWGAGRPAGSQAGRTRPPIRGAPRNLRAIAARGIRRQAQQNAFRNFQSSGGNAPRHWT